MGRMLRGRARATHLTILLLAAAAPARATVPFAAGVVDAAFHGDCKALGDFDGDGLLDVAVGGRTDLRWYRSPAFTPHVIAVPAVEFTTDMQSADVDGDGDPDLVVPDYGSEVLWFENPRPAGDPATAPWVRHVIGAYSWAHDVEVGDVDGNGRIDVLVRPGGTTLWLQTGAGVWTRVDLAAAIPDGEGAGLGDVDGDGDLDVALNGYWLECPASPASGGAWVKREMAPGWPTLCGARVADVDGDGRRDIVLSASESTGRLSWFRGPVDPQAPGPWSEVVIAPSLDYVHTFQMADVDGNGQPDVVFAEMAQSASRRVGVFFNDGAGAAWHIQVLSTSGSHNVRAGDMGADGDVDIVGSNWQGPPVEWWENGLCTSCSGADDFLVGEGLGPSSTNRVRIHAASGAPTTVDFQAYGAGRWGTNVAALGLDATPAAEILTGPGPGEVYGPHVRGFARDGVPSAKVSYYAYGTLKFGANVGGGAADGDAYQEILTGPGPGSVFGPHVRGWNVDGGGVSTIAAVNFFAYGTLRFGVNISAADVEPDAFSEILTAPGPGSVFGPQVRGWNHDGGAVSPIGTINFNAFATTTHGANVAGGDADGDAAEEIAAAKGPGPSHAADLSGFAHDGAPVVPLPGYAVRPFATLYGARVGLGDVLLDARAELLAGAGRDPAATSRVAPYVYDGTGLAAAAVTFTPFGGAYGVNVTGGPLGY